MNARDEPPSLVLSTGDESLLLTSSVKNTRALWSAITKRGPLSFSPSSPSLHYSISLTNTIALFTTTTNINFV